MSANLFSEYVRQLPVEESGKSYRCTINGAIIPYEYNTILFKPDKSNVSVLAVHCYDFKGTCDSLKGKKIIVLGEIAIGEVYTISIVDRKGKVPEWDSLRLTAKMRYMGSYKSLGTLAVSKDHLGTETLIHIFNIAT